jgi:hypothetical protein
MSDRQPLKGSKTGKNDRLAQVNEKAENVKQVLKENLGKDFIYLIC